MTEDLRTSLLEEEPKPKASLSISAIISFISGIFTYLMLFFHSLIDIGFVVAMILSPVLAMLAVFTGHKAKRQIRNAAGNMHERNWQTPGCFLAISSSFLEFGFDPRILGLGGLISALGNLFGLNLKKL
jgi:hypothetical protein